MKRIENKYIFDKILSVFAWVSLFVAVVTAILTTFAVMSGEDNGKEIFGHKILLVNTNSMSKSAISENEPISFNAGDVIVISKINDPNDLKVGDVISFLSYNAESMGKTVSHKIREIKYSSTGQVTGIVTYGINTGVNDVVEVKPEHLVGKYVFKIPVIGNLFSALKTPRGFYLSILIPGVSLIIFFSIRIGKVLGMKEFEKEQKNNTLANATQTDSSTLETVESKPTQPSIVEQNQTPVVVEQIKTPTLRQTISITYMPSPYMSQPAIYQSAPSQETTAQQDIVIAPVQTPIMNQTMENAVPINSQAIYQSPITIYQIIGNDTQIPQLNVQHASTICQSMPNSNNTPCNPQQTKESSTNDTVATTLDDSVVDNDKLNIPETQKKPFSEKLINLKKDARNFFNKLHNELTSYKKVNSRISFRGMSYKKGRVLLAKIGIRGKTLTAYFNLDVNEFNPNVYFQKDMSDVKAYEEVPFALKIKSERACNNAIKLTSTIAEKFNLEKNLNFKEINFVKNLKNKK